MLETEPGNRIHLLVVIAYCDARGIPERSFKMTTFEFAS